MRYAVIMAGGSGKRLWPLSRSKCPKQLLPLLEGKNLLSMAVGRLEGLFEPENIYIIANAEYSEQISQALPHIPSENIIGEPEGRDTANAIALGAEILAARDEDATMAVFTADHVIRPVEQFADNVRTACQTAEANTDALVTFGIRPTWPHPGLGYIHCENCDSNGTHEVIGFKEKPDHPTARRYVESGQYFWNSGMFIWKVGAIRGALQEFLPESLQKLDPLGKAMREGKNISSLLAEIYPTLPKISIDYAVMEKAHKVLMVELKCEWIDVGSWPALEDVLDQDESGNVIVADEALLLDCSRNIVVSEGDQDGKHLLAVLGMDDCIIVHSPDATLVCNKSDSQRIKELVDLLGEKLGQKYL